MAFHHRALIGCFVLGIVACASRAETAPSYAQQIAANGKRYGVAGQAVLVMHNGKTLYRGSEGLARRESNTPVRVDHVFPVFSVSKLFVSILVMQLVESGDVDLKAPIGRYVADLPERWRGVKIEELLNHVSGLPDYFNYELRERALPATAAEAFRSLADQPVSPPGVTPAYNQINFILLAAVLEAHYKLTYRQIATQRIIERLELRSTYLGMSHAPKDKVVDVYTGKDNALVADYMVRWPEYAIAHAELYSTVDDLGRFLQAVGEGRMVKRDMLLGLWKPYRYKGGVSSFASGWDYSATGRFRHVGHDGGTKVRVRLTFDDAFKDVYIFIYLTNGSASNVWSRTLVDSIMPIAAPGEFQN